MRERRCEESRLACCAKRSRYRVEPAHDGGVRRTSAAVRAPGPCATPPRGPSSPYSSPSSRPMPTVPGPPCTPMTGPSRTISIFTPGQLRLQPRRHLVGVLRRGRVSRSRVASRGYDVTIWKMRSMRQLLRAHALSRMHLAVADGEDRLHAQHVPDEGARAADAAAPAHVLQRVQQYEDPHARDHLRSTIFSDLLHLAPPVAARAAAATMKLIRTRRAASR